MHSVTQLGTQVLFTICLCCRSIKICLQCFFSRSPELKATLKNTDLRKDLRKIEQRSEKFTDRGSHN